jgi:hypothetical protein
VGLLQFPFDDGLRHLGLAFGAARPWGEVYPFSVFEAYPGYDPWWGYDLALRAVARLASFLPGSRLLHQLVLTKLLALCFVGALVLLAARRSRMREAVKDGPSLVLALLLLATFLGFAVLRFTSLRPFAFGALYVLFAAGARGAAAGVVSTALLFFVYPYLAWLYVLPAAVAHLWRGRRAFGLGAAVVALGGTLLQPAAFWHLQAELFRSDAVRGEVVMKIGEFAALWQSAAVLVVLLPALFLLVPRLPTVSRRLEVEQVLMLLFLPISIKYVRYFVDLELPLAFVAYGRGTLAALLGPFTRTLEGWRGRAATWGRRAARKRPSSGRERSIAPVLAALYVVVLILLGALAAVDYRRLRGLEEVLEGMPRGSLAVTEFNLQYRLLYARPDLRLVPSSEIGFPSPAVKREYLAFLNEGNLCGLAQRVGAAFFVEARGMYLDPRHVGCLELMAASAEARVWRVRPRVSPSPEAMGPGR